ncbi:PACE efflux transporter [Vibrio renipiscarius]|uniref:Chlorhexidine efflux transporter domain-containing protein n=1 Tax=Vibrio renipiscarius TaxID=1461322 RepID=A0A0C2KAF6_9VIBR|nr:PACE efflux transporter [Vibrio renipiscarius]KII75895.1 hypothetical protein OJ16_13715 [Vibrio renipiscarius]KII78998.1 hypothetical protein PL18_09175 [Vibrio renipiscarius]
MTTLEKIFNVILFEVVALSILVPSMSYLTNKPLQTLFFAALSFSCIVVTWNYIFNNLFDSLCKTPRVERGLKIRTVHTLLFEAGLIVIAIPALAWFLQITFFEAFIVELGFLVFFLFFNPAFHFIYDKTQPYKRIVRA